MRKGLKTAHYVKYIKKCGKLSNFPAKTMAVVEFLFCKNFLSHLHVFHIDDGLRRQRKMGRRKKQQAKPHT